MCQALPGALIIAFSEADVASTAKPWLVQRMGGFPSDAGQLRIDTVEPFAETMTR